MSRRQERLMVYAGGVAAIVGGAFLTRVDPLGGAALVAAGTGAIALIQKEALPRPHRRMTDPADTVVPPVPTPAPEKKT